MRLLVRVLLRLPPGVLMVFHETPHVVAWRALMTVMVKTVRT